MTRPLDPALELALSDLRRRVAWTRTGRVYLELHKLAGQVIEHRVTEEHTTEREVERVMQTPPYPRDDALDRKELADVKRDYARANLSEVIADLRAAGSLQNPRKALRAFAKKAHEQKAANLAEARRARDKIAAMSAGIRGMQ